MAANDVGIEDQIASRAHRCGRCSERDATVSGGGEGLSTNDGGNRAAAEHVDFRTDLIGGSGSPLGSQIPGIYSESWLCL